MTSAIKILLLFLLALRWRLRLSRSLNILELFFLITCLILIVCNFNEILISGDVFIQRDFWSKTCVYYSIVSLWILLNTIKRSNSRKKLSCFTSSLHNILYRCWLSNMITSFESSLITRLNVRLIKTISLFHNLALWNS